MSVITQNTYDDMDESGSEYLNPVGALRSRDSDVWDEDTNAEGAYVDNADDTMKTPNRLRLAFKILIVVNMLLLLLFIFVMTPAGQLLWKDKVEAPKSDKVGQFSDLHTLAIDNFKLCTSCKDIRSKLSTGQVKDLTSDVDHEICCFQTISQLFWVFEKDVQDAISKSKQNTAFNSENALTVKALKKPIAHLFLDTTSSCENTHFLKWTKGNKNPADPLMDNMKDGGLDDSGALVIPRTAYYFVYAHVQHNNRDPISLRLNKNNHPLESSSLPGVFYLKKNDKLTLDVTCDRIDRSKKNIVTNYFGIFPI